MTDKPRSSSNPSQEVPLEVPAEVPVKSPCVSVCALDDNDICTGCFRSGDEIRLWGSYSNDQRREVLALAHEREKRVNPFL